MADREKKENGVMTEEEKNDIMVKGRKLSST